MWEVCMQCQCRNDAIFIKFVLVKTSRSQSRIRWKIWTNWPDFQNSLIIFIGTNSDQDIVAIWTLDFINDTRMSDKRVHLILFIKNVDISRLIGKVKQATRTCHYLLLPHYYKPELGYNSCTLKMESKVGNNFLRMTVAPRMVLLWLEHCWKMWICANPDSTFLKNPCQKIQI